MSKNTPAKKRLATNRKQEKTPIKKRAISEQESAPVNEFVELAFDKLGLSEQTLSAIAKKGFTVASEIQGKVIPIIVEQKQDIIGIAQTGTGKTGAFGLPLLDVMQPGGLIPQAIILAPTRELALQVTTELNSFIGERRHKILTVYGGASISLQLKTLRQGVDIVVGTPGRVLDLLSRKKLQLSNCQYFILDEADEMLKMGFIDDVETILSAAAASKRLYLFSATMPQRIKQLAKNYMNNSVVVEVSRKQEISKLIEQSYYRSKQSEKRDILATIIDMEPDFYGIIFCRTKSDVDMVTNNLKYATTRVDCIHGDVVQSKREKILQQFRDKHLTILVATDVAARGIDVENLSHVINYNLPDDIETYTHRIGRTGRAGKTGKAISLITPAEQKKLSRIEKLVKVRIDPLRLPTAAELVKKKQQLFMDTLAIKIATNQNKANASLVSDLLEKHSAEEAISALLPKFEVKQIARFEKDSSRDRDSNRDRSRDRSKDRSRDRSKDRSRDRDSSDRGRHSKKPAGHLKVFIAKGNKDKMGRRQIIRFIEREASIKLGEVSDVQIREVFSFITLEASAAHSIVAAFKKGAKGRPLAELANN